MHIRETTGSEGDLIQLLALYTNLHEKEAPELDDRVRGVWGAMMANPGHHVLLLEEDGRVLSGCVVTVIPNLTRGQRPYALVENVVTAEGFRGRGYASAVLEYAATIAKEAGCYKIMLLTGAKEEGTLAFYEKNGYNRKDKTGMIRWL